jgi:hypothetical protein
LIELEPPYSMIDELAERPSVTEANKLLCEGWVLIKSAELLGVDQQGCQIATIMYILGHVKDKKRSLPVKPRDPAVSGSTTLPVAEGNDHPTPRRQAVAQAAAPSPPNILSLPIQWRQKKDQNPNFYYAFVFGLDGSLDPIVSSVVDAIKLGNGGIIEQDGWKFTVSKDGKFLQRSRHSPTKVVNVR